MPGKKKAGKRKIKSSINRKRRKIRVNVISHDSEKGLPEAAASMPSNVPTQVKIRKNALQIKAEADREEEEMLARERLWETPAFLRRKK